MGIFSNTGAQPDSTGAIYTYYIIVFSMSIFFKYEIYRTNLWLYHYVNILYKKQCCCVITCSNKILVQLGDKYRGVGLELTLATFMNIPKVVYR